MQAGLGQGEQEASRRRAANAALGWRLGGVALMLFLLSLWMYRPI